MNFEQIKKIIALSETLTEFDNQFAELKKSFLTLNPKDIAAYGLKVVDKAIESAGAAGTLLKALHLNLVAINHEGDKIKPNQLATLLENMRKFLNTDVEKLSSPKVIKDSCIALYGMLRSLQHYITTLGKVKETVRNLGFNLPKINVQINTLAVTLSNFVNKLIQRIEMSDNEVTLRFN